MVHTPDSSSSRPAARPSNTPWVESARTGGRVSIRRQCGTGTLHWDSLVRKSLMAEVLVSLPPMMGVVSVTVLLLASRSLCTAPWPCEDPLFL